MRAAGGAEPVDAGVEVGGTVDDVDAEEGQVGRGLPGEGGEQLAPAAPDVDDLPTALLLREAEQGRREDLAGGAMGRGREVPGRPLGPAVEAPFAVEGIRPRLLPRPHPRIVAPPTSPWGNAEGGRVRR